MKLVLFFLCIFISGCDDNLTLNQIVFNKEESLKVTIDGHINKPGLYLLKSNETIIDLINKAGGYKNNALRVDEKKKIKNNDKIFVNSNDIQNKISINNASSKQLETIKGIGPATAKKIIEYRQRYGNFKSVADIKNVKGIKDKLFSKIYKYLKT